MSYLFQWVTGEAAQVSENFSAIDLLAVKSKTLSIYKFVPTKGFYTLRIIQDKVRWTKVNEARVITNKDARLHIK